MIAKQPTTPLSDKLMQLVRPGLPFIVFMLGAILEALTETQVTDQPGSAVTGGARSWAQSDRIVIALGSGQLSMAQLALALGLRSKTGALKRTVHDLLEAGIIEYTIPAKPTSRLQKYRLTAKGRKRLK